MTETSTVTQYAITDSVPPQTWSSEWVMMAGDRIAGGDPPPGFRYVDEPAYHDALRAQDSAVARRAAQGEHEFRLELSRKRRELRAAGLTEQVAQILVPDPNNDYSIDS